MSTLIEQIEKRERQELLDARKEYKAIVGREVAGAPDRKDAEKLPPLLAKLGLALSDFQADVQAVKAEAMAQRELAEAQAQLGPQREKEANALAEFRGLEAKLKEARATFHNESAASRIIEAKLERSRTTIDRVAWDRPRLFGSWPEPKPREVANAVQTMASANTGTVPVPV
jgi:Sec-independent protein translocase protein TatA